MFHVCHDLFAQSFPLSHFAFINTSTFPPQLSVKSFLVKRSEVISTVMQCLRGLEGLFWRDCNGCLDYAQRFGLFPSRMCCVMGKWLRWMVGVL